uniref:DUF4317 family protein n=1 Tax=Eubacterium cellulosolvens TaxID=29322 RepID=UPI000487CC07|nr:DUF4317 family protein [[Eubacterium] cellulosolvens]
MGNINREDMLELTRRMTSARSNLVRIAGAYIDADGYIEGTFNTNFLNLKGAEKSRCLDIAKAIPFSRPNEELKQYPIPGFAPGSVWQLIYAIRDCGLKNDALMLNLYELIAENYPTGSPYAIYVYYGAYDVPRKATDKSYQDESEETYQYLILAIAPVDDDRIPHSPEAGFLYPAFTDRSTDPAHVNFYSLWDDDTEGLRKFLGLET